MHGCNLPWISNAVLMAPDSQVDDGYIHLVIMQKVSRFDALRMFLMSESGTHIHLKSVKVVRCVEFGIVPDTVPSHEQKEDGCFVVDGNLCEIYSSLTAKVVPKAIKMHSTKS